MPNRIGMEHRMTEIRMSFRLSDTGKKLFIERNGTEPPERAEVVMKGYSFPVDELEEFIIDPTSPVQKFVFDTEIDFFEPITQGTERLRAFALRGLHRWKRDRLFEDGEKNYVAKGEEHVKRIKPS